MYEDNNDSELEQENMDCNESEHERILKIIDERIDYHYEMLGYFGNKKKNIKKKGEQEYNWDERSLKIIDEHRYYYYEMVEFLDNYEKKGLSVIQPKKPTSRIPTLNQSKSNRLIGYELHEYLKKYITSTSNVDYQEPNPNIPFNEITFERIWEYIKQCASYEEQLNNHSLGFHVRFGDALESFFAMWKEERIKNQHTISWKGYLEENFRLKERNTCKKREVAKILIDYPKLQSLTLSFNETYNRKNDIKTMLRAHPEIRSYWK